MAIIYSQINEDCKRLWKEMYDNKDGVWNKIGYGGPKSVKPKMPFQDLDALAMLYEQTGDKRYAQEALQAFSGLRAGLQAKESTRRDPLRWTFTLQPQMILSSLRPLVYSSAMLDDAIKGE